jgi:hypothetical protein
MRTNFGEQTAWHLLATASTPSNVGIVHIALAAVAASLPMALAGGWVESEPLADSLPESFSIFRTHALGHSLRNAATTIRTRHAVPSKSPKKNPAERQNSDRLPEGDLTPAKERRQQPIPQAQHYFASDADKEHHPKDRQRSDEKQFLFSHIQFLMIS